MTHNDSRFAWASTELQQIWEPRLTAIHSAWLKVEIESVGPVRSCALVFCSDEYASALPLRLCVQQVSPGRFAIATNDYTLEEFLAAWHSGNDMSVGEMLGFPECCRRFFHETWNTQQKRDTTLSMSGNCAKAETTSNILGRWAGTRLVPHLPCSWQCLPTHMFADRLNMLWTAEERSWVYEWLSWPTRYSALHGIAIITNPVLKIVAGTDYTAAEHRRDYPGVSYPEHAPSGLSFPFQRPAFVSVNTVKNFKQSLAQASGLWTENGFRSLAAMQTAHDMILSELVKHKPSGLVVDLGCGNGELLKRIQSLYDCPVMGIECDKRKIRLPFVLHDDLRTCVLPPNIDTIIVSQRRFEEISHLEAQCKAAAKKLLVYSYDAPLHAEILCS